MKKKETILETIELLKSTSQFINDSRAALCAPYGLSHPQAILSLDIYHHPNQTKITDICKRLNKTTNTISPLVKRMMDKGYLTKKQNQEDNRVYEVSFTPMGKDVMSRINQDVYLFANPIFNRLTDEEFESLRKSLVILNGVCGLS